MNRLLQMFQIIFRYHFIIKEAISVFRKSDFRYSKIFFNVEFIFYIDSIHIISLNFTSKDFFGL